MVIIKIWPFVAAVVYLLSVVTDGIVADVYAHLFGEATVVGGIRGGLPRHAQLGQRSPRHARRASRQLAAKRSVVELLDA